MEFKLKSCWNEEYIEDVKIEKMDNDTYSVYISYYSEQKISKTRVDEILTPKELDEKIQALRPTIEVYPFILPIGKCFYLE